MNQSRQDQWLQDQWLHALTEQCQRILPAILVTVARAEGSVPREPGAKMLVTESATLDTIGGGHLELQACAHARHMLALKDGIERERQLVRFALGPTLGQCCGGVVWLAFERIEAHSLGLFQRLQQCRDRGLSASRVVALGMVAPPSLYAHGQHGDACIAGPVASLPAGFAFRHSCCVIDDPSGACWLIDPCLPARSRLFLFGAGHVGAAIVRALAGLPCHVTWIDEREDMFPRQLPQNVTVEATDVPEAIIDAAPPGAAFLVMTHSHALDQRLAEHILRRDAFGWFGLIGSRTKRIQFERRLRGRGIADERLSAMVCPIGVPGITGKEPGVIAVAVAAQLLQVWERQRNEAGSEAPASNTAVRKKM